MIAVRVEDATVLDVAIRSGCATRVVIPLQHDGDSPRDDETGDSRVDNDNGDVGARGIVPD